MPWNGSGQFRRSNGTTNGPTTWAAAKAAARKIRTDDHDNHDEDLASGLENCVTRDGQNSPTASLPMNGQKHTGVANAAANAEYAAWGQTKSQITSQVGALENSLQPSQGTLTDGASIAWDLEVNPVAEVTLGGNRTLANPANPVVGGAYILTVVQDATGGRSLAYGTDYDFGEEGSPALSSAANKSDTLSFLYRNSKMQFIGIAKGHG
ncbi:MAG: hypothetical protein F4145_16685 [Boseongicola sp. SB0675_bin_26]|nr:hypothetical protein [Boseongicola sp. SB0675_bin_26]